MEKGVLTKAVEKLLQGFADDAIDAKGFVEMFDGPAIGAGLSVLDNNFAEKYVKEPLKTEIRDMVDKLVIEKDAIVAAQMATEIQQKYLNIPGFDDDVEKKIVNGMLDIAFGFILKAIG